VTIAPLLPIDPLRARRDPAVVVVDETVHCFHTVVDLSVSPPRLWVEVTTSTDLVHWSPPTAVTPITADNFSSPGNAIRIGDEWVLFLQSYPIAPGEQYGSADCTLWFMRSRDLAHWTEPQAFAIEGAHRRRIDPFVIDSDGVWLCLHKVDGGLETLESTDLHTWRESAVPVLAPDQTPGGVTVENPAVVRHDGELVLFFSPCRPERGVGVAVGERVGEWDAVRYLAMPEVPWAPGGLTASVPLATPWLPQPWALFVHGDTEGAHGGALAVLVSDDLENWRPLG
jgi:hypothetical protein